MLNELKKIQELYKNGNNIIDYIKTKNSDFTNSTEAIMISYDMQAGSYIKFASERIEYIDNYTQAIAKVINRLGIFNSIIEVGVGEATTFANLLPKLNKLPEKKLGFDISWSRIKFANEYIAEKKIDNCELFIGDIFNIPIRDNSIDIVYTSHSIEPNGGREKQALIELFRITKNYLILLEPSFEFADNEGKQRMERLGYVKNLSMVSKELGYNIIEHRLFDFCANPLNPTGLIIIEKEKKLSKTNEHYSCPISKSNMELLRGSYYCKDSLLAYPIVDNIPCLLPNNAIIASHYI